jgi:hypothetical protein
MTKNEKQRMLQWWHGGDRQSALFSPRTALRAGLCTSGMFRGAIGPVVLATGPVHVSTASGEEAVARYVWGLAWAMKLASSRAARRPRRPVGEHPRIAAAKAAGAVFS